MKFIMQSGGGGKITYKLTKIAIDWWERKTKGKKVED